MSDRPPKARVREIAASLHGKVLSEGETTMRIEIPADLAMAFVPMMIASGGVPMFAGQVIDLAPRRLTGMAGHSVVLDDEVTTAFYRYDVAIRGDSDEA